VMLSADFADSRRFRMAKGFKLFRESHELTRIVIQSFDALTIQPRSHSSFAWPRRGLGKGTCFVHCNRLRSCHERTRWIILVNRVKTAPVPPHRAAERRNESFASTRWTVVLEAGDSATASAHALNALSELCRIYWRPLYAVLRKQGYGLGMPSLSGTQIGNFGGPERLA
jgi:hypothetical protein